MLHLTLRSRSQCPIHHCEQNMEFDTSELNILPQLTFHEAIMNNNGHKNYMKYYDHWNKCLNPDSVFEGKK